MRLHGVIRGIVTCSSVGGLMLGSVLLAPPAEAASYDGKYWYDTSCTDGSPVYTKTIPGTSSGATVQLYYSKKCRTVWVLMEQVAPYTANTDKIKAWVHRNSDGKEYQISSAWEKSGNSVGRWSKMLNDADVSSYGAGSYNGGTVVKTPSY